MDLRFAGEWRGPRELPPDSAVPWHRVVNARGAISLRGGGDLTQRILLEREGLRFGAGGRIDLTTFGWRPRRARTGTRRG